MKAHLFAANSWHAVSCITEAKRPLLACDSQRAVGFFVHLSGFYTAYNILDALRCVAKLQSFVAGTTGELCAECFPGRALAPVVEQAPVGVYVGDGHPLARIAYEADPSEPEQ